VSEKKQTRVREISLSDFKKKYRAEYDDLLLRLGLISLQKVMLKVSGIKSLKIFSVEGRRYFSSLVDARSNPIAREEIFKNKRYDKDCEQYILTIAHCDRKDEGKIEKFADERSVQHMEYALMIKNKIANFGLVSMEKSELAKHLIAIFLFTIEKMVDIEATNIVVPDNDAAFLQELQQSGYHIDQELSGCYNVKKLLT
jgi:hypothetical protein